VRTSIASTIVRQVPITAPWGRFASFVFPTRQSRQSSRRPRLRRSAKDRLCHCLRRDGTQCVHIRASLSAGKRKHHVAIKRGERGGKRAGHSSRSHHRQPSGFRSREQGIRGQHNEDRVLPAGRAAK
jgi:hypothetical protein